MKESSNQLSTEDLEKIMNSLGGKSPTNNERYKKALVKYYTSFYSAGSGFGFQASVGLEHRTA